ncbi:molybdopterin-dependent oxidoreductase (plasmid) [Skermanella sp. TT6]|uniref:Molybdopterin-dependent oxidoreductase n=1 Tax=Skermanella cutis TaxID=2775420 RepID=A0ABX7BHA1_9PROT|nr:molybdopterin-dependent oxidoreductase [Skermanella sp. TT6]QQP93155.1 molybdopterin-dependent oxidoreductase [Skermanella sp. TT6]
MAGTHAGTRTDTHCPYCAFQCGMTLVREDACGEVRYTVAARDFPTNRGGLCRKGWTAADLLSAPDRLTTPLMRDSKDGPLRPASWNEALDRITDAIGRTQREHGPAAVGIFGGGGLTNEKSYMLGKFARVALRTPNIDYNGRFCMASAAAAGMKAFGIDRGLPFPLEDIGRAEVILLVGGNPAESLPVMMQYFEEQKRRGGRLIVVDPRVTPTAALADLHLQITPGTDAALGNALLNSVIRQGYLDLDFIGLRTVGFEQVRRTVGSYWPDRGERITGVPADRINEAARMLGTAGTAMVLTARGPEQQSTGVDNVLSFINLALALGKVGKPFCGFGTLTGQGNGQGGREHGQKADQLPGYRKLDNPEHRAHAASVWGVEEASLPGPGLSACELLAALGREEPGKPGIRVLLVMASNIAVSAPDVAQVRQGLRALDLLVVSDMFLSETAGMADVVLPIAQWAEEEGTMTNLEGRVQLRRRAKPAPDGVRTDLQVIKALADRLGRGAHFTDDAREAFGELRRASSGGLADYSGITWERVAAEDGVFWPCPDEAAGPAGTPRLFLDRFPTPDGRARFSPVGHRPPDEEPDQHYPLYLTTGRVLSQYQSGAQTRRVPALLEAEPEAFVEIHPGMARSFGIRNGDRVRLVTRRGDAVVKARLVTTIRMDTLFVPFHWGGAGCANLLTNAALDPVSRIPEFKVCAVRLEAADLPPKH